jgi:hypothetical protein
MAIICLHIAAKKFERPDNCLSLDDVVDSISISQSVFPVNKEEFERLERTLIGQLNSQMNRDSDSELRVTTARDLLRYYICMS